MKPADYCRRTKDCAHRAGHEGACVSYGDMVKAVAVEYRTRVVDWLLRSLRPWGTR